MAQAHADNSIWIWAALGGLAFWLYRKNQAAPAPELVVSPAPMDFSPQPNLISSPPVDIRRSPSLLNQPITSPTGQGVIMRRTERLSPLAPQPPAPPSLQKVKSAATIASVAQALNEAEAAIPATEKWIQEQLDAAGLTAQAAAARAGVQQTRAWIARTRAQWGISNFLVR